MQATTTGNQDIVRRVVEAINNHDLEGQAQFIAPTATQHTLYDAVDTVTGEQKGYESEVKLEDRGKDEVYQREMFPEEHMTIDEMFDIGDDKVLGIFTTVSTHKSGKQVTVKRIDIIRIVDGKMVESWNLWDRLGYWQQLGIVPKTHELLAKLQDM
jgi:ketosteroid isomerase-like protein